MFYIHIFVIFAIYFQHQQSLFNLKNHFVMKKHLLLLIMLFVANISFAQGLYDSRVCLGTIACVTLNLDQDLPNRVEIEIPKPKETMMTTTCLYGPGQPRIESVESTVKFSINTKMLRADIGEVSTNVFYDMPVDKWYNDKTNSYTTSYWEYIYPNDGRGWTPCYYQVCISVNVTPNY